MKELKNEGIEEWDTPDGFASQRSVKRRHSILTIFDSHSLCSLRVKSCHSAGRFLS